MQDTAIVTLIASAWATLATLIGSIAIVYYRLGRLEGKLEEGLAANRAMTAAEGQRLSEKMDLDYARLSQKMDLDNALLSQKMDALHAEAKADNAQLSQKMDLDNARLLDKVDALRTEVKADYARLAERMDTQHAETVSEIRRLVDAFVSHSHEPDGNIIFRIPPGSGTG